MVLDFDTLIDNHIKRETRPKGIGKYYPSEVGTCLRKTWYSYKYPSEIEPELAKIFEMGNIIHDFIVQVLKSEKNPEISLLESEFPFKVDIDDFMISGRVDNMIKVKLSGEVYLIEVKSVKDIKYTKEAAPHNIVQLQLYMHFTGVHNGLLLYVDKGNLKTKVFEIEYNKEKAEEIVNRFKMLHKHLKEDIMPEPEGRAHKEIEWMCKLCEYRDKCEKDTPKAKHEFN
ncbi:CRISPR-associated exonuclease Cas4 [Candidatus Tiddalikarchaeum anstoanum]|nr:CRISPR-associated exonuclease Cas4 [Candidatus Tiddalikarchaeum anstoanum]